MWQFQKRLYFNFYVATTRTYEFFEKIEIFYGFGELWFQKYFISGSPYTEQISLAILKLREEGRTDFLKKKWWRISGECSNNVTTKTFKQKSLTFDNVSGLCIILGAGLGLGIITAIMEFIWNYHQKERFDKVSYNL